MHVIRQIKGCTSDISPHFTRFTNFSQLVNNPLASSVLNTRNLALDKVLLWLLVLLNSKLTRPAMLLPDLSFDEFVVRTIEVADPNGPHVVFLAAKIPHAKAVRGQRDKSDHSDEVGDLGGLGVGQCSLHGRPRSTA